MVIFNKMLNVFLQMCGAGPGQLTKQLSAGSRHLVHSTCNTGSEDEEWCPSLPLKSSVHPSTLSYCPWGSRRPQLNTDLPEQAQVQQGVCPTAKCCVSVSLGLWGFAFLSLTSRGVKKAADASVWSVCQYNREVHKEIRVPRNRQWKFWWRVWKAGITSNSNTTAQERWNGSLILWLDTTECLQLSSGNCVWCVCVCQGYL